MANVATYLGANEGANEWDRQNYLPDHCTDEGVERMVDDIAEHQSFASLPGARISTNPRRSICLMSA
jgi:hypothetical protein